MAYGIAEVAIVAVCLAIIWYVYKVWAESLSNGNPGAPNDVIHPTGQEPVRPPRERFEKP